jgi:ABC-type uncharacterized transport system ATPase subunit
MHATALLIDDLCHAVQVLLLDEVTVDLDVLGEQLRQQWRDAGLLCDPQHL